MLRLRKRRGRRGRRGEREGGGRGRRGRGMGKRGGGVGREQGGRRREKEKRRSTWERNRKGRHTQTKLSQNSLTACFKNRRKKGRDDKLRQPRTLQNGGEEALPAFGTSHSHISGPANSMTFSSRRSKNRTVIGVAGPIATIRSHRTGNRRPFLEGIRKVGAFGAKGKNTITTKGRGQFPLLVIPIKKGFAINQINTRGPII